MKLVLAYLLVTAAAAQNAPVPREFQDLYGELKREITAFDDTVSKRWEGHRSPVVFSAELSTANANRGARLLQPQNRNVLLTELGALQNMGVQGVVVAIGYPMMHRPFQEFNGTPADQGRFLEFYQWVAGEVRQRKMKLIVETSLLFPGVYSRNSGFRLADYYATLSAEKLAQGRAEVAAFIAREIRPDFLNLGSEPDTQAKLAKRPELARPAQYAKLIDQIVKEVRAGGSRVPLSAGVGTWKRDGLEHVRRLCDTGIDSIDLHIYPVFLHSLDNVITFSDAAIAAGKKVGISEAWLAKTGVSEIGQREAASDPTVFARDPMSFWAPLDQQFLSSLIKFCHWKNVQYFAPFWAKYFFSYVDYDRIRGAEPIQAILQSNLAAYEGMRTNRLSETGELYKNAIAGKLPGR